MKAAGLLLLVLFAIVGCTGKPYVVEPAAGADGTPIHKVYVVSHGWHVGLVVPAEQLNSRIPGLKERFGEAEYYELGWGDEGFYQAPEITTAVTLRAIVWSKGTVMHVVALPVSPDEYFAGSDVVDTCLTTDGAESLTQYLSSSFARDADNNLVKLKPGIYGNSQFYKAEGRYHLLNTSNKWTAKALESGGMAISPAFRLMAESVMASVEENRLACV